MFGPGLGEAEEKGLGEVWGVVGLGGLRPTEWASESVKGCMSGHTAYGELAFRT